MKLHPWWLAPAIVAGCGLVNSNTLSYDYSFDPQGFMESFGSGSQATVPMVACDPAGPSNQCAQVQAALPSNSPATVSCEATSRTCAASVELRLPYPVDLSMQNLPPDVVQFGASKVSIEKIAYWIMNDQVNVAIPPIDLYVASAAAKDENDASAKLVGTVSMLPAMSAQCMDAADSDASEKQVSNGLPVCDISLSDSGESALAGFVKDYMTPFQFIAHTKVVAHAGDPLPSGDLSFFVRPTVQFSVLK
ncbi:MAG TPA: hypothetical protein VGL86_32240 [Polyangia bacterium]|jgi:hypothetical protein